MSKIKICPICKKEYTGQRSYCSNEHVLKCTKCGKIIDNLTQYKILKYIKTGNIYCSYSCASDYESITIKGKQTKLQRYGNPNYNNQEKLKQTCLERYGRERYLTGEMISKAKLSYSSAKKQEIEKMKQATLKKHYGEQFSNASKIPEVRAKISNNLKHILKEQHDKIVQQRKQTSLQKYGNENYRNIEQAKQTKLERYGDENYNNMEQNIQTCLTKYGVHYAVQSTELNKNHKVISKLNKDFANLLNKNGLNTSFEKHIENFSYDIFIEPNTLIEINPTFTHNSTFSFAYVLGFTNENKPIDSLYHFNKTIKAKENGYHCINIFDWDNKEKILSLLKPKEILYARKCVLKELNQRDTNYFLYKYHLQGKCNGQKVCLGLFYNNELVQVMTFGKPRYNKNYQWELLRLCTKTSYQVVGGTEKLFKYFLNNYNPNSIISYCDYSKFTGNVYIRLGFLLDKINKPSKHWYNEKTGQHITDNLLRQRGFDQLFKTNYGKGTSNEQLMLEHNFVEVYDCGQGTYIWKK